jgi:hypothetical protein
MKVLWVPESPESRVPFFEGAAGLRDRADHAWTAVNSSVLEAYSTSDEPGVTTFRLRLRRC